jgi:hypothetical protein
MSYLEEALLPSGPRPTPLVVKKQLPEPLVRLARNDPKLAQSITSNLELLTRDAKNRARLGLNRKS